MDLKEGKLIVSVRVEILENVLQRSSFRRLKRPYNVGKKEEKQIASVRMEILEKGLQRSSFVRLKTSR